MTKVHPTLAFVSILILIVSATYMVKYARSGDLPGLPFESGSRHQDQVAQILEKQTEILSRLERLESMSDRSRPSRLGWDAGPEKIDNGNAPKTVTSAEIAALQAATMRSLDNKFADEPLSAAWATKTERNISSALSVNALVKEQATAPKSMQSTCRSQTCKISLAFDNSAQADFTKGVFLQGIAESLPSAQIFLQEGADGSVNYVIYAQTGGYAGPRI